MKQKLTITFYLALGLALGTHLVVFASAQATPQLTSPVVIYDDLGIYGQGGTSQEIGTLWANNEVYINQALRGEGTLNIGIPGNRHQMIGAFSMTDGNFQVGQNTNILGDLTVAWMRLAGTISLNGVALSPSDFASGGGGGGGSTYTVQGTQQSVADPRGGNVAWQTSRTACNSTQHIMISCQEANQYTPLDNPIARQAIIVKDFDLSSPGSATCNIHGRKIAPASTRDFGIRAVAQCYSPPGT
jgi:hypothetical protein